MIEIRQKASASTNWPVIVEKGSSARGVTVGTAESCTGGMMAGCLDEPYPGSSSVVRGGVVTYAMRDQARGLGVANRTLDRQTGAVSSDCA